MRNLPGASQAVLANVEQGIFEIPLRLSEMCDRVKQLLGKYCDVPMDLADATLVCLAERFDTPQILTLDRDFSFYRWQRNRGFRMLIPLQS